MEKIVEALLNPEAYPGGVKKVKLLQTHISWIFLTGKYAYKVKKPVNFGFCDFTTLTKRKFYCEKEVKLNRRLSPEIYLKVVPIVKSDDKIKIEGRGKILEYAVKMKEISQEKIMTKLLLQNKVTFSLIGKLAKIVADFHKSAKPVQNFYGLPKTIRFNWVANNLSQVKKFLGVTLTKTQFNFIRTKVLSFLDRNKHLFLNRIKAKKIKDCHGDLHSGNIFVVNKKLYIFDTLEFNDKLRCGDVTRDIAFFTMDLDYHGRNDLSEYFLKTYLHYTQDEDLLKLLPFYQCYYAFVRGKVTSLLLASLTGKEKKAVSDKAKKYFELALNYAKQL